MSNTNKAAIEAGTRVPAIFAELGLVNTKPAPSVAGLWHRLNAVASDIAAMSKIPAGWTRDPEPCARPI